MTSFYECVEIELKSFIKQYCFIEPNDELLSLIGTQWDQLVSRIQNDERNRVLRDLWDDLLTDVFKSSLFEQFSTCIFKATNQEHRSNLLMHHGIFHFLTNTRLVFSQNENRKDQYHLLTLSLLTDVLDSSTIPQLTELFSFVQKDEALLRYLSEKFQDTHAETKKKVLSIVASLNKILEQTSKTHNNKLRGLVLQFMAFCCSLDERSAVNLHGLVNFSSHQTPPHEDEDENKGDAILFYTNFWSVQSWLQNPRQRICDIKTEDRKEFDRFYLILTQILSHFEERQTNKNNRRLATNAVSDTNVTSENKRLNVDEGVDREEDNNIDDDASAAVSAANDFFVCKYLTSKNLFELQLDDEKFRRQILVQILMALGSVLLANTFALDSTKSKSKISLTLTYDATNRLKKAVETCTLLLKMDNPIFARNLFIILDREANFANWKWVNKCNKIVRLFDKKIHQLQSSTTAQKTYASQRSIDRVRGKMRMMLNNKESDVEKLLEDTEHGLLLQPNYDTYVKDVITGEVERGDMPVSYRKIYGWKAMRLLSRKSMDALSNMSDVVPASEEESMFTNRIQQVVYEYHNPPAPINPPPVEPQEQTPEEPVPELNAASTLAQDIAPSVAEQSTTDSSSKPEQVSDRTLQAPPPPPPVVLVAKESTLVKSSASEPLSPAPKPLSAAPPPPPPPPQPDTPTTAIDKTIEAPKTPTTKASPPEKSYSSVRPPSPPREHEPRTPGSKPSIPSSASSPPYRPSPPPHAVRDNANQNRRHSPIHNRSVEENRYPGSNTRDDRYYSNRGPSDERDDRYRGGNDRFDTPDTNGSGRKKRRRDQNSQYSDDTPDSQTQRSPMTPGSASSQSGGRRNNKRYRMDEQQSPRDYFPHPSPSQLPSPHTPQEMNYSHSSDNDGYRHMNSNDRNRSSNQKAKHNNNNNNNGNMNTNNNNNNTGTNYNNQQQQHNKHRRNRR